MLLLGVAIAAVAALAPRGASAPEGVGFGPPERSVTAAAGIVGAVREAPSSTSGVRAANHAPHSFVAAGYWDVCDDADGPVDLRRTIIEHDDEEELFAFAAIACAGWDLDDLGDQMLVWEIFHLDGRGGGPDHAVTMFVNDDGELRVRVLELQSNEGPWPTTYEGSAQRSDGRDVYAVFPSAALEGEDVFWVQLVLIDNEGELVDALPELDEPAPLFPSSCDLQAASAATLVVEPGRDEEVRHAVQAAGLEVTTEAAVAGVVGVRGVDDRGLEALRHLPGVRSAERPVVLEQLDVEVEPDDPRFPAQWALGAIEVPRAWAITTASDVRLAIVDDGVDAGRAGLRGRVGAGHDLVADRPLEEGVSSDRGGHGTSVAAVAAATGDDGHTIAGVDWGVEIVPYRVSDGALCIFDTAVAAAIRRAADDRVDVVNLSLGTTDDTQALRTAVAYAEDHGVTLVAAVGNAQEFGNEPVYPASYETVIGVGAITRDDEIASYSNTGEAVSVVAPGGDGSRTVSGDILTFGERGELVVRAGTSLAAPHVAAALTLHRWLRPDASPSQDRAALAATAIDLGRPGWNETYGHGLLDVHALLRHAGGFARVQGPDRVTTGVATSRWTFGSADAVVIASSANYPDALAAGPLAGALDAPLLITSRNELDERVVAEILRLGAAEAWIVGGTAALSASVEKRLTAEAGIPEDQVHRLGGEDRWETAAAIAEEVLERTGASDALLALGGHAEPARGFPDALSASAYGADLGVPVLLVLGDRLPDETHRLLTQHSWDRLTAVGGTAAIPDEVFDAARDAAGLSGTPRDRLSGEDRYETSIAVADAREARARTTASEVLIATGANWPDALSAGPAAAEGGAAFLLTPPSDMTDSATEDWIGENRGRLDIGWISGGSGAVSRQVARQAAAAIR